MNSIETSIQSSDIYDLDNLDKAYPNATLISQVALVIPLTEMVAGVIKEDHNLALVGMVSILAWGILSLTNVTLIQHEEFFKNRHIKAVTFGVGIAITLIALYYLKINPIFPLFQAMCHYSAYLQLEGLTLQNLYKFFIEKSKEITSSQGLRICFSYFALLSKLNGYFQYLFLNALSALCIPDLLALAYSHKLILSFRIESIVKKLIFFTNNAAAIKQFEISVEYLIRCKREYQNIDEAFINSQLNHLVLKWNGFSGSYFPSNLSIINGVPLIKQSNNELGDISALKQKLIDCFGSAIEIN